MNHELPDERAEQADEADRHEILPADGHHLVHAYPGKRPAQLNDNEDEGERLGEEDPELKAIDGDGEPEAGPRDSGELGESSGEGLRELQHAEAEERRDGQQMA